METCGVSAEPSLERQSLRKVQEEVVPLPPEQQRESVRTDRQFGDAAGSASICCFLPRIPGTAGGDKAQLSF